MPQDPVPITETEIKSGGVTLLGFGGTVVIIVLSITILTSLIEIWYCVGALLDKDNSMNGLFKWSELFGQTLVITLNFINVGLCFLGAWYLDRINISLGGDKLRVLRHQKIHKAKNPLGDTDEWCCKHCGYINNKRDSECKSCGKYK